MRVLPVPQELIKLERREYPFSKFDCKQFLPLNKNNLWKILGLLKINL